MLKMLYRKLNKNKDYRFLDAEAYRKHSKPSSGGNSMFKLSEKAALNVDFCSATDSASLADIQYFRTRQYFSISDTTDDQDFITVDSSHEKQVSADFNYKPFATRSNVFEINDIEYISLKAAQPEEKLGDIEESNRPHLSLVPSSFLNTPKLGVFSDSKAYSAFVKSELSRLEVDIQHFNHPRTLSKTNNLHLDTIDAWIIFLSEESEDDFLDHFLDRFFEKPTLFLVPKTGRKTSATSIKDFVQALAPENVLS